MACVLMCSTALLEWRCQNRLSGTQCPFIPIQHQKSTNMTQALVGVIGGSGLYQMDTPFGDPTDVPYRANIHAFIDRTHRHA